jgi:hypothetical protein
MNTLTTPEIIGDIKRVPDHQQLGGHTINGTMTPPLIAQVAQALNSPSGHSKHVRKVAYFISQALTCFMNQFPYNHGMSCVLEDMQNGQVYEIAGDGTPFETFESEDVTKYMSARFDTTSTYCFNPDLDIGTMVCFDKICTEANAQIGVMAYNVWAMKWVSYRYGFHKIQQICHKVHALAASRNRLTLTWAGLLNLTGERLPPATCKTCATLVVRGRADVSLCGGCRDRTYCSRACQKEDWPHHRKTCVKTFPPVTRLRETVRFAKFCREHASSLDYNKFVEGMSMVELTTMQPKRRLESMRADARDVVVARNERMQLSSKSCKNSRNVSSDDDDVEDGALALVRFDKLKDGPWGFT